MLHGSGVPMICCGEEMEQLVPNTAEASVEKHLPVATVNGDILTADIGGAPHPMLPEHYIEWVYIQTASGGQRKCLSPGREPTVSFSLGGDTPTAVFAYCNIHGLWLTTL
jgi:superoxide reductase